jgi:hypothetical protein
MRRARRNHKPRTCVDKSTTGRGIRVLRFLEHFGWFCSKQNRYHIKLISAGLKKDADKMQRQECSEVFIQQVLLWHTVATMLPIMWHAISRLLAGILPIRKLIGKIAIAWTLASG